MCVLFPEGFSLSGGHDSLHQVVYVSDINPKSVAATEGHLQLLDIIHYVNGVSTQGMTLEEVKRALDMSVSSVVLKATRYCASVRGGCLRGHRHFRVLKDRKFSWKDIPELAMHRLNGQGLVKFVCLLQDSQMAGSVSQPHPCLPYRAEQSSNQSLAHHHAKAWTVCRVP